MLTHLDCTRCDKRYEPGRVYTVCSCGAPLYPRYDLAAAALEMRPGHLELREPTMWRYREVLPLPANGVKVSLGEGFTPLLAAPRLGARLGLGRLLIKEEGFNPTGSFKARGLAMAVSMAKALGATDVCLPSAGNAGSALAAYAASAGLKAHVFLPRDIAKLFVMETEAYGAQVEMVDGLITDAGRVCAAKAKQHGWYECATLKEPYRVEGKKTMGYEIAEQLDWALPDAILYPTGGGTGLVGMWKAFAEMETMGFVGSKRPRMYAVQAEGCAPIVKAFQEGREDAPLWENATTHAHGLRVPKALGDFLILRGVRESHGSAIAVSEAEIVAGVKQAAAAEGLFMAPESGACVAAARKLAASGQLSPDDRVVLFDTGTGYKYVENMAPLWGER
jgi:threonine synthase